MAAGDVSWPVFALMEVRGKGGVAGSFKNEETGEEIRYGNEYRLERYEGGDEEQVYQVTVRPNAERVNMQQCDESALSRGDYVQVVGETIINQRTGQGRFKMHAMVGPLTEDGQPKKKSRETAGAAA